MGEAFITRRGGGVNVPSGSAGILYMADDPRNQIQIAHKRKNRNLIGFYGGNANYHSQLYDFRGTRRDRFVYNNNQRVIIYNKNLEIIGEIPNMNGFGYLYFNDNILLAVNKTSTPVKLRVYNLNTLSLIKEVSITEITTYPQNTDFFMYDDAIYVTFTTWNDNFYRPNIIKYDTNLNVVYKKQLSGTISLYNSMRAVVGNDVLYIFGSEQGVNSFKAISITEESSIFSINLNIVCDIQPGETLTCYKLNTGFTDPNDQEFEYVYMYVEKYNSGLYSYCPIGIRTNGQSVRYDKTHNTNINWSKNIYFEKDIMNVGCWSSFSYNSQSAAPLLINKNSFTKSDKNYNGIIYSTSGLVDQEALKPVTYLSKKYTTGDISDNVYYAPIMRLDNDLYIAYGTSGFFVGKEIFYTYI